MDDASERRVRRQRIDLEFESAGLVDRPREDRIADRLVDRDAFARDRRLVDAGTSGRQHAVHRHALTRTHLHDGAEHHGGHRHGRPAAVGLAHQGFLGRHFQQAFDGVAGAIDGPRLDRLGDGIQRHHHGSLWPLPDHESAGDGHRHQRIDVQPPMAQRRQTFFVDVEASQPDGGSRQRQARGLPDLRVRSEETKHLRADGEQQGATQPPCAARAGAMVMAVGPGLRTRRRVASLVLHGLRIEAGFADRNQGLFDGNRWCVDGHRALTQLEGHRADTGDVLDCAPDFRLLAGTVHRRYAKAGPTCGQICAGERGCSRRSAVASAAGIGRLGCCSSRSWRFGGAQSGFP